jgi:hypothetical protein
MCILLGDIVFESFHAEFLRGHRSLSDVESSVHGQWVAALLKL